MSAINDFIHALTAKTTPVDADELLLLDSAASNASKKITWANLKAAIVGRTVAAKTANYTVVVADDQKIFTNAGAAGDIIFTLPASGSCTAGKTRFKFVTLVALNISVRPAGTDHLQFFNATDATAGDAVNASPANNGGAVGESMEVLYLGSGKWLGEIVVGNWTV